MVLHRVEQIDNLFGLRRAEIGGEAEDTRMHSFGDGRHLGIIKINAIIDWAWIEERGIPAADEITGGCQSVISFSGTVTIVKNDRKSKQRFGFFGQNMKIISGFEIFLIERGILLTTAVIGRKG